MRFVVVVPALQVLVCGDEGLVKVFYFQVAVAKESVEAATMNSYRCLA